MSEHHGSKDLGEGKLEVVASPLGSEAPCSSASLRQASTPPPNHQLLILADTHLLILSDAEAIGRDRLAKAIQRRCLFLPGLRRPTLHTLSGESQVRTSHFTEVV